MYTSIYHVESCHGHVAIGSLCLLRLFCRKNDEMLRVNVENHNVGTNIVNYGDGFLYLVILICLRITFCGILRSNQKDGESRQHSRHFRRPLIHVFELPFFLVFDGWTNATTILSNNQIPSVNFNHLIRYVSSLRFLT